MAERKYSVYQNQNGADVEVHKVTKDTAGGVYITGEGYDETRPGDLLVRDNANSFSRLQSLDGFTSRDGDEVPADSELGSTSNATAVEEDHPDDYDPSQYKVREVQSYLERHPEAREQIVARESEGKNRTSIVNA